MKLLKIFLIMPSAFLLTFSNTDIFCDVKEPSWPDFSANITEYLKHTSFVNIIEGKYNPRNAYVVSDFYDFLVKYLRHSKRHLVALNLYKTFHITCPSEEQCEDIKRISSYFQMQSLFFFIYNSHHQVNESFKRNRWDVFKNLSVSLFFIVSLDSDFEEEPCSSTMVDDILKQKYGYTLTAIWNMYQISEIFVYLPQFCGSWKILKFNPLVQCISEEDCSTTVEIITDEAYRRSREFLSHGFIDFKKYPLKVNAFPRDPTLVVKIPQSLRDSYYVKDIDSTGYLGGVDGFFIGNLVKKLNFQPIFFAPSDNNDYGMSLPNGTLIGSLADVVERRADISINARFFKLYKTDQIEFTIPISIQRFCLIAPKAKRIPHWMNILQVFEENTWYLILGTSFLLAVIWWLFKTKLAETPRRGRQADTHAIIDIFLLIVNRPTVLPTRDGERILIVFCLFFNLLFVGIFQGYLTTAYTTTSHFKDINTLQEAYDTGMSIASSIDDLFGVDISPLMTSLSERVVSLLLPSISMVEPLHVFAVERDTDAAVMIEMNFTLPNGEPRLHVVQECPRFFYLNYIVYKGYPFLRQINRYLMAINSAGLPEKWYDITQYTLLLNNRLNTSHQNEHKPLSYFDMQAAFFSLYVGQGLSIFVFLCEILYFRIKRLHQREKAKLVLRSGYF